MIIIIFLIICHLSSYDCSEICETKLVGVTVPETDRFNAFHNCQGCSRHRWISIRQLTPEDRQNMHGFRHVNKFGDQLYPCRVFLKDQVVVGTYNHQDKKCSIGHRLKERKFTSWFQVLTIPGGLEQMRDEVLYKYELQNVKTHPGNDLWDTAVPAGQLSLSNGGNADSIGYIAFGRVHHGTCLEETIGVSWRKDVNPLGFSRAYFPLCGKEKQRHNFDVLVCKQYRFY